MGQERSEFEECEAVFRKDIKRIPEQFVGAGSEGVEVPAMPEHLRKLGDLHEAFVTGVSFQGIQTDRVLLVSRFDDNEVATQVPFAGSFVGGNRRKQERRRIAVQVEVDESAAVCDVLLRKMTKEGRLSGASLTEDCNVLCTPVTRNDDRAARHLFIA